MSKRIFYILLAVCGISLVGQLLLYPRLPEIVPTHWNFSGQIDGWGERSASIIIAAVPLAFTLLFYFLPSLDPRRKNYRKHQRAYNIVCISIIFVFLVISWATTLNMLGLHLPLYALILGAVGLLLLVTGNYMPQFRPNYFIGIRTPWTIDNEVVWRKTHRVGGIVFCVAGIGILCSLFIPPPVNIWLQVCLLVSLIVIPTLYSFVIHRNISKK